MLKRGLSVFKNIVATYRTRLNENKMKKIWVCLISFVLVFMSVLPVNAASDENSLSSFELEATRFIGRLSKKTDGEIAESILWKIGMPDKYIQQLPMDEKEDISNCTYMQHVRQYVMLESDGAEVVLTPSAYEVAVNRLCTPSAAYDQYDNLEGPWEEHGQSDYIIKDLYIFKTKNAPTGTYGIVATYSWTSDYLHFRGEEVFAFSSEALSFERNSFSFSIGYTETVVNNGKTTTEEILKYYNVDNLPREDDLKGSVQSIAFQYNLPNNVYTPISSVTRTNLWMLITVSSRIINPKNYYSFNIYADYFHQTIGIGSIGVSVNLKGASVSVSPSMSFKKYTIQTGKMIEYLP